MKDQDLISQYCDYIVQNPRTEANEALFVDMIMQADNIQKQEIVQKLVSTVLALLKASPQTLPGAFQYQLCHMLFEAYDISPRFCGALNGELSNISYKDVNFYL